MVRRLPARAEGRGKVKAMNEIAAHFAMLMEEEEQLRIGATSDEHAHMRVMRVLAEYEKLRSALEDISYAGHVGFCRRRAQRALGK